MNDKPKGMCEFCRNEADATEHLCHTCADGFYNGDLLDVVTGGDPDLIRHVEPFKREASEYWQKVEAEIMEREEREYYDIEDRYVYPGEE